MDAFAAIAEPTRRRILEIVASRDGISATEIYGKFRSSAPAISQHLKVLKDVKLVRVEKRAQKRIYYVNPGPMQVLEKWIRQFASQTEDQFKRLDDLLAAQQQMPDPAGKSIPHYRKNRR